MTVKSSVSFAILGSLPVKAAHKHVDEIDPRIVLQLIFAG